MSLDQFQIITKLGDGSYSSVYKIKRLEDNQIYALKKVKIQNLSDREKENALNEVRILASIKNPFVAAYREAFFDEPSNSLCIVMEFADDGDVFQRICESQNNKQFIKEKHVWKIVIQVVRGLKALHELQILHRDMKSANIFLYKDQTAKLGDLNVSKVAKRGLLYTQTGTPYYASPEVWKDQPYDLKSDIWSLGCVTYEMCALVPPFRADDMNGLFKRVLKGQYPPIPSHYSMDMRMLIKTLLQVQPATRPNTEQILEMPVVIKRIKKYFPGREAYFVPGLFDDPAVQSDGPLLLDADSELLRTIKLQKNVFKLSLPHPTYGQNGQNANFATIPGTTVINQNKNRGGQHSKSPQGVKHLHSSITKTTAITNSKNSLHSNSKVGIDELTHVSVGLPKIKSKSKQLAAIDDSNEEEYYDRMPSKPHGVNSLESDDATSAMMIERGSRGRSRDQQQINNKSSSVGTIDRSRHRGQQVNSKKSNILPQVSSRSRQSFEESGDGAYSGDNGRDSRNARGNGLNQSPSVISLHDQSKASINVSKAKRSSKPRGIVYAQSASDNELYADEIKLVTGQYSGGPKANKKTIGLIDNAQQHISKRARGQGVSQSALDNVAAPAILPARGLNHSPSTNAIQGDQRSQYQGQQIGSGGKKKVILGQGSNSQQKIQTGGNSGLIQINNVHPNNNYKRIVNIYSVNNYKNKRKSHAPESRVALNHSMLPGHSAQGKIGPYDHEPHIQSRHGNDISLPDISSSAKNAQHYNSYDNQGGSVGRPYAYKSNIDSQNSAMIAKLMTRKKSYERIMRMEDASTSDGQHKKNTGAEVLMSGQRGGVSALSRAQASGSTRKQLQYYDSTPQRKPITKKHHLASSSNQGNVGLLDITGSNMTRVNHVKSSAYLNNANAVGDLQ